MRGPAGTGPAGVVPRPGTMTAETLLGVCDGVLKTLDSEHSRRAYGRALSEFIEWWGNGGWAESLKGKLDRAAVVAWRRELVDGGKLAAASVNQRLAAIRALARELATRGMVSWELAGSVASIKGVKDTGVRVGVWLSKDETERLLAAPNTATLRGLRDAAVLRLVLSAGLRRDDVHGLVGGQLVLIGGRWALSDVRGKGGRVGTVPIAHWAAAGVHAWWERRRVEVYGKMAVSPPGDEVIPMFTSLHFKATAPDGRAFRPLSEKMVSNVIKKYGKKIGRLELAAHDLRRTFAQHAEDNGAPLKQVQMSLRHADISTTSKYLGDGQDFNKAPCDYLDFKMPALPGVGGGA